MAENLDSSGLAALVEPLKQRFGPDVEQVLCVRLFIGGSPLKGRFKSTAHQHLAEHTARLVLGLPVNGALTAFFDDVARQGVELDRAEVERVVQTAVTAVRECQPDAKDSPPELLRQAI